MGERVYKAQLKVTFTRFSNCLCFFSMHFFFFNLILKYSSKLPVWISKEENKQERCIWKDCHLSPWPLLRCSSTKSWEEEEEDEEEGELAPCLPPRSSPKQETPSKAAEHGAKNLSQGENY